MKADKVDVTVSDDNYMTGVMFSSRSAGESIPKYWLFGRSEEPEEVDKPIYIEKDDQAWSTYGGVEECILGRDEIRLRLDESAASEVRTEREVVIEFSVDDTKYALLRQAFDSIFRGYPGYGGEGEI